MCQRKEYSLSIASHPEPRKTKRRQNLQSLSIAPRNIDGDVTSTTNMAASSPTSKQTLATPLHHFPDARFWPTNSSVDASAFVRTHLAYFAKRRERAYYSHRASTTFAVSSLWKAEELDERPHALSLTAGRKSLGS
jgi:hypothetical protein